MSADFIVPQVNTISQITPDGLRVNLLRHAFGVPKDALTFSWMLTGNATGEIQTAYRIYIAHRLADVADGNFLFDTGWIATDETSDITPAGLETVLEDNELYYWTVQIRDRNGLESQRAEPMLFLTAVGEDWEDDRGIWSEDAEGRGSFAFLRTEFKIPAFDGVERVFLNVTAVSPEKARQYVYQVSVNGAFVGLGPARLGKDPNGEELVYYNTYDITDRVNAGVNALGAVCYTTEEKSFLCQMTVYYKNGTRRVVLNTARDADDFRGIDGNGAFGPYQSIGTQYYEAPAENFNALIFPFGFDQPGFDAKNWLPVRLREELEVKDERRLEPYPGEPVERVEAAVASMTRTEDGCYRIDLGQEIIGGLRLSVNSPLPHTVRVRFGEELNGDGSVRYKMRTGNVYEEHWTLCEGEQTLENFGMKTFRYVEIVDYQGELSEDNVRGVAIRRAFDADASSFECPNEILCYLYDTFKYAICATNQDLYVDSQSRERRAYEGDALINMLSALTYESDTALARFSADYLISHRTWPAEYVLLMVCMVWQEYMYSGNRALMDRVYPQLKAMLAADEADEYTGLMPQKAAPNNGWDAILVDWPGCSRDEYRMNDAFFNTVYNATWHLALNDMTSMASVLGMEDDAVVFRTRADNLRHAMIETLYDPAKGAFRDGLTKDGEPVDHFAQHATAMALCAGVCDTPAMADVCGRFLVGQGNIRTSIYGAYYLVDALYGAGFGSYATALLANDDMTPKTHAWGAALHNGNVTLAPEAWCVEEKGNMTFSHPWGSAPAALIVRGMLGIRPTHPGFHKFEIRPQIGDLPYVSLHVPTVKGTIGVTVAQNGEAFEAEVTVPVNTTAEVYLPYVPGGTDQLFVNGQKSNFPLEDGRFIIRLGSGTHRLLAQ